MVCIVNAFNALSDLEVIQSVTPVQILLIVTPTVMIRGTSDEVYVSDYNDCAHSGAD